MDDLFLNYYLLHPVVMQILKYSKHPLPWSTAERSQTFIKRIIPSIIRRFQVENEFSSEGEHGWDTFTILGLTICQKIWLFHTQKNKKNDMCIQTKTFTLHWLNPFFFFFNAIERKWPSRRICDDIIISIVQTLCELEGSGHSRNLREKSYYQIFCMEKEKRVKRKECSWRKGKEISINCI